MIMINVSATMHSAAKAGERLSDDALHYITAPIMDPIRDHGRQRTLTQLLVTWAAEGRAMIMINVSATIHSAAKAGERLSDDALHYIAAPGTLPQRRDPTRVFCAARSDVLIDAEEGGEAAAMPGGGRAC
eukprot:gene51673-20041_t